VKILKKDLIRELKEIYDASDTSIQALVNRVQKKDNKKTLYQRANDLCNKMDRKIMKLTRKCKDSPCIISEDKKDIFTKMYNINKAFEYIAKARALLREVQ